MHEYTSEVTKKEKNVKYEDNTKMYPENIEKNEVRKGVFKEVDRNIEDNNSTDPAKNVEDERYAVARIEKNLI